MTDRFHVPFWWHGSLITRPSRPWCRPGALQAWRGTLCLSMIGGSWWPIIVDGAWTWFRMIHSGQSYLRMVDNGWCWLRMVSNCFLALFCFYAAQISQRNIRKLTFQDTTHMDTAKIEHCAVFPHKTELSGVLEIASPTLLGLPLSGCVISLHWRRCAPKRHGCKCV